MKASTGFFIGLLLGLGAPGQATVPCGSFDQTELQILSVSKGGAALPLPAQRTAFVMSEVSLGQLYDPDTGMLREVFLTRVQP